MSSPISAMHLELNVTELLASLNETLTAGGSPEPTQAALESEVVRYAKGLKLQGYSDAYIASVMASLAITYAHALMRSTVLAVETNPSEPVAFMHQVLEEML